MSDYQQKQLPFTEEWQEAIIGHCITNPNFFSKCNGKLQPNWFSKNILLGTIYDQLVKSHELNGVCVKSAVSFKGEMFFNEQKHAEREKFWNLIDKCVYQAGNVELEKLERNLTGFLRISMFKEAIEGSGRIYRTDGYEDAFNWTTERLKEIKDASFVDNKIVMPFDNPDKWIEDHEIRKGHAISTGCSILDDALGGGLFKKEACAFLAPANVGKTTAMITLARHAIWQKKKVLFIIHEGFPEEIRIRFLASFLGVTTQTIYKWRLDPTKRPLLMAVAEAIKRQLTYVPYIKTNAMFVEDVIEMIKKLHNEEIERTGQGFDLVIDDYPKKLKSRQRSGQREGLYRVEVAEIYDSFNHLAAEIDVHCFLAIQTNRTGLKQNNGRVESEFLLGMEEMDESFGIAQNVPNIITLNRSPQDKTKNVMRMNVTRSRNSETDIAIITRTNYACCLSFGDKNMFESPDKWPNELDNGYLPSYAQKDNSKPDTELLDRTLAGKVGLKPDVEGIGAYVPGAALEEKRDENS
jgi:replicative DNA helicase